MNIIMLYMAMKRNVTEAVTRAALPCRSISIIQEIDGFADVKGAAMEASASERETPAWADFKAPQSLAPSPHIDTV